MLSVISQTFSKGFVHIHYISVYSNLSAFFLCHCKCSFSLKDVNDLWMVIYFRTMISTVVSMRKI